MSVARTRCVVYVANADSQDLSIFSLREDGDLTPLGAVVVQRPAQVGRSIVLALNPKRDYLYAGHLSGAAQSSVATYAIDQRTALPERIGSTPLPDSTAYLATDRTGRFLLSASYGAAKVSVNAIMANGVVGDTLQTIETEPKAHCIITDPSNRYALHTSVGGDLIYQRRFDAATGKLLPNEPLTLSVRAKSGPRFVAFAPDGAHAYVVGELDATIDVYPFAAAAGTLGASVQTVACLPDGFTGRPWGADIHMRPDGRFLYVSERTTSTLLAFSVGAGDGRLTRIDSYPTVERPRAFNVDPSGSFLLAAGQLSNSVVCHLIDAASGELICLREHRVGRNPTWVEIVGLFPR